MVGTLLLVDCSTARFFGELYGGKAAFKPFALNTIVLARMAEDLGQSSICAALSQAALLEYPSQTKFDCGQFAALNQLSRAHIKNGDLAAAESAVRKTLASYYDLSVVKVKNRYSAYPISELAYYYQKHGYVQEARQMFEVELARLEAQKSSLQAQNAYCNYRVLADIYQASSQFDLQTGYYATAEKTAKRALVLERMGGHESKYFIYECEMNAGISLLKQMRYEEAETYLNACKRFDAEFGRSLSTNYINLLLAITCEKTGRQSLSADLVDEDVLAAVKADDPTGCSLSWAADLLTLRGRNEEALQFQRQALRNLRRYERLEFANPQRLKFEQRLAEQYYRNGKFEKAERRCQRVIEAREQALGVMSLDTARSYVLMADIQAALNKPDAAKLYSEKALNVDSFSLDVDSPLVTLDMSRLAHYRVAEYAPPCAIYSPTLITELDHSH